MILLDAYAVIAFLRQEAAGGEVERLLRGDDGAAISAVNAAEVIDRLVRVYSSAIDEAVAELDALRLYTTPVDLDLATAAGRLRSRHYHRTSRSVGIADCIAAATLLRNRFDLSALATSDPALLAMVHEEGGSVHPLPQTDGGTWSPTR